jgi:hypothetical protein
MPEQRPAIPADLERDGANIRARLTEAKVRQIIGLLALRSALRLNVLAFPRLAKNASLRPRRTRDNRSLAAARKESDGALL